MDNWGDFISEGVYVLKDAQRLGVAPKEVAEELVTPLAIIEETKQQHYTLGVVAHPVDSSEQAQLDKILAATGIALEDILTSSSPSEEAEVWLIFANEMEVNGQKLYPTTRKRIEGREYIVTKPLSVLMADPQEKLALWQLLKEYFKL